MVPIISISTLTPLMRDRNNFLSDVTFLSWLGKSVNPNFSLYQSDTNNSKFNFCLEIQSKTVTRISISTLNPLKLPWNQIHIWRQFPVMSQKLRQSLLFQIRILKNKWIFLCCFKNHSKKATIIFITTFIPLMWHKIQFLIWRYFLVLAW